VLFTVNATSRLVTATFQVAYSGNATDFAWVLPLPSVPTSMGISSDVVFRALHSLTDPTFSLNIIAPTGCTTTRCASGASPRVLAAGERSFGASALVASVDVVSAGQVGPFVFQVVRAKPADVTGQALFDWLKQHAFNISDAAMPIVSRYVRLNYPFVALKLQKGKTTGELVPIVVKYVAPAGADLAQVPLRLTAVAAQEMPVFVWVAGAQRAVPQNFVHIKPDLRALPWTECAAGVSRLGRGVFLSGLLAFGSRTQCAPEYQDLLKSTAKTYGMGKWLTTEFAGAITPALLDAVYDNAAKAFNKSALIAAKDPSAFLTATVGAIPSDLRLSPLMLELLRDFIPKPAAPTKDCATDLQFYAVGGACLKGYVGFDSRAAANAVESRMIEPIRQTRAELAKHAYITRFYGTFTPENMVRDPVFRFASGLPDVSNVHRVNVTYSCPPVNATFPVTLTYADGSTQSIDGARYNECGGGLQLPPTPKVPNEEPMVEVIQAGAGRRGEANANHQRERSSGCRCDAGVYRRPVGAIGRRRGGCATASLAAARAARDAIAWRASVSIRLHVTRHAMYACQRRSCRATRSWLRLRRERSSHFPPSQQR
jgi:hypothetical protein